jgi:hypothetical protein
MREGRMKPPVIFALCRSVKVVTLVTVPRRILLWRREGRKGAAASG